MAKGRKTGGRRKGSVNKTTASVKQALTEAFTQKGGVPALLKWAKANETEFYKLWGRLVPVDVTSDDKPLQPGVVVLPPVEAS